MIARNQSGDAAVNSPERMLAILDLFDGRTMEWSGDAMAANLG